MAGPLVPSTHHSLVWFRNDLRITDNPALFQACQHSEKVTAVYFIARRQWQGHHLSERRIQFTFQALESLQQNLARLGIPLAIIEVDWFSECPQQLAALCDDLGCDVAYCNYEYALDEVNRDKAAVDVCREAGIKLFRLNASVVIPPGKVTTKNGQPFKVFTPFKRAWLNQYSYFDRPPLPVPPAVNKPLNPKPLKLANSAINTDNPEATEDAAFERLATFVEQGLAQYHRDRDQPALDGTSHLSPYLTVGLISPHSCLQAVKQHTGGQLMGGGEGSDTWVNELIWREFYLHLLAANPAISRRCAMKPETDRIAWRYDRRDFKAWCQGRTGYPLVDAAMVQLNTTGWMHNRLRMVTATFLTKYLLIDWRWGEDYFMEQLLDGHFASNNGGWQWCASTGTDAAPYFRILQPLRQTERFDPQATFIKTYLPRLSDLSPKTINQPGHPDLMGVDYPPPIVDLSFGRERCLEAFKAIKPSQK